MTSRERILSVLKGNNPDRIPWIPLCSGAYLQSLPNYNKKWNWLSEGWYSMKALKFRINFYRHGIGADYMEWGGVTPYRVKRSSHVQIRSRKKGNRIFGETQTPVGTLTEELVYSERAHTIFPQKDYLETTEDMKIFQYVLEDEVYEPNYEPLVAQLKELGEEGVFFLGAPSPSVAGYLLGKMRLENFVVALYEHKVELDNLVKLQDAKNEEICRILAKSPGKIFCDETVTGTGMISPKIYEEYYLPSIKKYANILHKEGKFYLNHTSGEPVSGIIEMIKTSGTDGLYGLAYPPSGDMRISQVRQTLGSKFTVIGGLDPNFIATKTIKEIQDRTRYILKEMSPGDNFMLGTADDIPYGTPAHNLKAVSEVIQEYGNYPLKKN